MSKVGSNGYFFFTSTYMESYCFRSIMTNRKCLNFKTCKMEFLL